MGAASRVGSINVVLNTTFGPAVSGLNTFADTVEGTGRRTRRAVGGIDQSVLGMNRTVRGIRGNSEVFRSLSIGAIRTRDSIGQMNATLLATSALLGGVLPTLSGVYLTGMADRANLVANNLRTVTQSAEELKDIEAELFRVSQRSRASFEGSATIYARIARATKDLNISQGQLLRITETINKAFAAGGANPAEAKGAAIQLTQGIASDRFSGDEFRSVAENAPVLLMGISESLGVNIGKLREMAHAGQLTAKVVTEAILKSSADIDQAFGKTISTIGQAVVKLDNALLKYVSDSENVSVASQGIVGIIDALSENLDTVTDSLLILGGALTAAFGGRRLSEVVAYQRAVSAQLLVQKQATAATLERARAETAAAGHQVKAARAALLVSQQQTVSDSTLARSRKDLSMAVNTHAASVKNLNIATQQHAQALKAANVSGRAFAMAGRMASASWAFIGGPIGAALLALGGAMYLVQKEAMAAQERADNFAKVVERIGQNSEDASKGVRNLAREMASNEFKGDFIDAQVRLTNRQINLRRLSTA